MTSSLENIRRALAQLTFGIDTNIALGAYAILSFLFGEEFNFVFLSLALLFAYLPDLDFTYFLFLPREARKWGHWRYGFHHPLLFIPLAGSAIWYCSAYIFPGHEIFLTTLAVVCILGHFIHDSREGLHWVSPFTRDGGISFDPLRWINVQISGRGIRILSQEKVQQRYAETARRSQNGGVLNEITMRIEPVSEAQLISFAGCLIGLAALIAAR